MNKFSLPPPPKKRLIKTALHQAVLDERLHQVRLLVEKHGADVDVKDVYGRTSLMLACIIDNQDTGYRIVQVLLKYGADSSVQDSIMRTALTYACMNGKENIVSLLLKEDVVDLNEVDTDGNTPLHHAATCANPQITYMLAQTYKKFGGNADRRNKLGYTPLLLACKSRHFVSAYIILTCNKASPTLRDGEYNLNASDWVRRSRFYYRSANRSLISSAPVITSRPPGALSFEREDSMYQKPWVPICRLYRSASSAHSIKLPAIDHDNAPFTRSELTIQGEEARVRLEKEIEDFVKRNNPVDEEAKPKLEKQKHPPTAKLRAFSYKNSPKTTSSVSDIVNLFKLYSDQFEPRSSTGNPVASQTKCPQLVLTEAYQSTPQSIKT